MSSASSDDSSDPDAHDPTEHASTVLIIEDDPANQALLAMNLRAAHVRCVTAKNIDEGWTLIQSGAISLVVSDLQLGALTLLKRMRANPASSNIPVIIASGAREQEIRQAAMDAGASRYLTKPYPEDDLLAYVRQCLTGR